MKVHRPKPYVPDLEGGAQKAGSEPPSSLAECAARCAGAGLQVPKENLELPEVPIPEGERQTARERPLLSQMNSAKAEPRSSVLSFPRETEQQGVPASARVARPVPGRAFPFCRAACRLAPAGRRPREPRKELPSCGFIVRTARAPTALKAPKNFSARQTAIFGLGPLLPAAPVQVPQIRLVRGFPLQGA